MKAQDHCHRLRVCLKTRKTTEGSRFIKECVSGTNERAAKLTKLDFALRRYQQCRKNDRSPMTDDA